MEKNKEEIKQEFQPGDVVVIKGNLIGSILSGYLWTMKDYKEYFYRIVVDSNDCAYRIINNCIDQTKDKELLREDYETLMFTSNQLTVIELFEKDLIKYEL